MGGTPIQEDIRSQENLEGIGTAEGKRTADKEITGETPSVKRSKTSDDPTASSSGLIRPHCGGETTLEGDTMGDEGGAMEGENGGGA